MPLHGAFFVCVMAPCAERFRAVTGAVFTSVPLETAGLLCIATGRSGFIGNIGGIGIAGAP
jgi:hypothetical protein